MGVDTPGKMPRVARARTRTRPGAAFWGTRPGRVRVLARVHPARFVPLSRR